MRDLHTGIDVVLALAPATVTADTNGLAVDLLGCNAAAFTLFVDNTGDTLSGTVKFVVSFEEADADVSGNPATWTAVPAAKVKAKAGSALSVELRNVKHTYGVLSIKRFTRMVLDAQGTHASGSGLVAVAARGHLQAEGFGW